MSKKMGWDIYKMTRKSAWSDYKNSKISFTEFKKIEQLSLIEYHKNKEIRLKGELRKKEIRLKEELIKKIDEIDKKSGNDSERYIRTPINSQSTQDNLKLKSGLLKITLIKQQINDHIGLYNEHELISYAYNILVSIYGNDRIVLQYSLPNNAGRIDLAILGNGGSFPILLLEFKGEKVDINSRTIITQLKKYKSVCNTILINKREQINRIEEIVENGINKNDF